MFIAGDPMNPATKRLFGMVVEVLRCVDLLENPLADHGDPVAHRHRLDLVVCDVEGRRRQVVLDPSDLRAHLHAELRVQVGERLVHQERLRLPDDRAPHRDALPLPSGERFRLPLEELLEAEDLRRLSDPAVDLLFRELPKLEAERHVVVDGHVGVQRVVLEHHRDVPFLRWHGVHHAVPDRDRAVGDRLESRDHPKRGGLAAPRRADQDDELPVLDRQVQIRDRGRSPRRVDLRNVVEHDLRHAPASVGS